MALSRTNQIEDTDQVVVYKTGESDFYAAPIATMVTYMQDHLTFPGAYVKAYASPTATGFSVALDASSSDDLFLLMTPGAGYAAGTVVLPVKSVAVDGQRVMVLSTQAVTALTVNGNGATVVGAPSGLAANGYFTLVYDSVFQTWYRVG